MTAETLGNQSAAAPRERRAPLRRADVPRLYTIADRDALRARGEGERSLRDAVVAMADAGVGWVQLRAKRAGGGDLYSELAACCSALAGSEVTLWLDDRVDVAALLPVGGVHLGQQDLAPVDARRLLGRTVRIGASTHDLAQLAAAAADPAVDVVALGPIFATASKDQPDPVIGLDLLRDARGLTDKPLVAIGGIDATNAAQVLAAGADSVAVLAAACRGDVRRACRALLAAVA